MLDSSRPFWRPSPRGGRLALVVPTALLAVTAMVSPSFADDVTPDDGGETPAVIETPVPSAEPDPAPAVDPAPAEVSPAATPEPKPEPKSGSQQHSAPTPGAAFTDGDQASSDVEPAAAAKDDKGDKDEETDDKKIVVCKYVGTPPGVPDHIIVVSKSVALNKGWVEGQFPGPFADAHQSIALRWAVGNEQPGDEELGDCPLAAATAPEIPVTDECGPDNAVYGAVPTGHYTILRNLDGSITLKADPGYEFPGGSDELVYDAPADSNEPCDEPSEIEAPEIPVSDPCGLDNAVYGDVPTGAYDVDRHDDGSITLTAQGDATFAGGEKTRDYSAPVDNGVVCADTENEKKVVVCKYVTTPGGELDHIIIVSTATLVQDGWDGVTFPFDFGDAQVSRAIRFAKDGEQAKDVALAACTDDEAGEIDAPELAYVDPCESGNATYGEVPLSDDYSIAYNEDGSITLTALGDATFAGGEPTITYPVPVEENTLACGVDGEIEEEVPGEVGGIAEEAPQAGAALPNTGGPAGWLVPLGAGLVLAGAALVLARRRETV